VRLPENVDRVRGENMTLRFASPKECGYVMLFEAGSARLAHKMIALEHEIADAAAPRNEFDDPARPLAAIEADKNTAIAALNASRFCDGEGQHCLILTVDQAISLVSPIESIKALSEKGVVVTAHDFPTVEVGRAASDILERFERGIHQIAEAAAANVRDLGFFPGADGPAPGQ